MDLYAEAETLVAAGVVEPLHDPHRGAWWSDPLPTPLSTRAAPHSPLLPRRRGLAGGRISGRRPRVPPPWSTAPATTKPGPRSVTSAADPWPWVGDHGGKLKFNTIELYAAYTLQTIHKLMLPQDIQEAAALVRTAPIKKVFFVLYTQLMDYH